MGTAILTLGGCSNTKVSLKEKTSFELVKGWRSTLDLPRLENQYDLGNARHVPSGVCIHMPCLHPHALKGQKLLAQGNTLGT